MPFADAPFKKGQESPVVGQKGGRTPSPDGSAFEEPRAHHFWRYLFNLNYASLALKEFEAILISPNSVRRETAEIIPITFILLAKDTNVHKKAAFRSIKNLHKKRICSTASWRRGGAGKTRTALAYATIKPFTCVSSFGGM